MRRRDSTDLRGEREGGGEEESRGEELEVLEITLGEEEEEEEEGGALAETMATGEEPDSDMSAEKEKNDS